MQFKCLLCQLRLFSQCLVWPGVCIQRQKGNSLEKNKDGHVVFWSNNSHHILDARNTFRFLHKCDLYSVFSASVLTARGLYMFLLIVGTAAECAVLIAKGHILSRTTVLCECTMPYGKCFCKQFGSGILLLRPPSYLAVLRIMEQKNDDDGKGHLHILIVFFPSTCCNV